MSELATQFDELLESITTKDKATSLLHMEQATKSCSELLLWLDILSSQFPLSPAKDLLVGARSAMLESVAYIGLGFGRATITAIRTQIDLILAFTYFCNHPQEWETVSTTGTCFQLRSAIDKYHNETKSNFKKKLAIVEHSENNSIAKLYKTLSAHIHGQSPLTTPKSGHFNELVKTDTFIESLIEIQKQVDTCLSNYLTVVYIEMNISPPLKISTRIKEQLTPNQRMTVFFDI